MLRNMTVKYVMRFFITAPVVILASTALLGVKAADPPERPEPIPVRDYPIYDRVLIDKFLTSQTTLVVIQRLTATRVAPWEKEPPKRWFFEVNDFFGKRVDDDLITDFILKIARPWRLESRFNFGVSYRFAAGDGLEEPEVSVAPMLAQFAQPSQGLGAPPTVGVLQVSRVAFNGRETQALVYVGVDRPDGTGAGFLVWLERGDEQWSIFDTDVLWTVRPEQ
jgi:hypothetical protein